MLKVLSLPGFIRDTLCSKSKIDELKQAIKYGNGAVVRIDPNTTGFAYKAGLVYHIVVVNSEGAGKTEKVVYYATVRRYMGYIAPLSEWKVIR